MAPLITSIPMWLFFVSRLNFDNVPRASSTDKSRSQKRKRNLDSYPGGGWGILLFVLWGNALCQSTMKPMALFPHPTRCRKNQWGECSPFHIKYSSRILALFFVLMYPIDHLGFHVPVRVGIRVTNPQIIIIIIVILLIIVVLLQFLHFSISAFNFLLLYFNLDKSYLFQSNSTDFHIHLTFFPKQTY